MLTLMGHWPGRCPEGSRGLHWSDFLPVGLGPFVGSFLFAAVLRYPAMTGFASGRSACPACGRPIAARDLVPIVSWALLRGRCRACAMPIGWHYPAVEFAAAALAGWAATRVFGMAAVGRLRPRLDAAGALADRSALRPAAGCC